MSNAANVSGGGRTHVSGASPGSSPAGSGSNASSSSSDSESEEEPEAEPHGPRKKEAAGSTTKSVAESVKLLKYEKFNPESRFNGIDYGFVNWLKGFERHARNAQRISGQTWDDETKRSVLESFMDGRADSWVTEHEERLELVGYDEFVRALTANFSSKRDRGDLLETLKTTKKLPTESFESYAAKLKEMARSIRGGLKENQDLVLATFVANALPDKAEMISLQINNDAEDADAELEKAMKLMEKIAKDDGARKTKRVSFAAATEGKPFRKREAFAAVTDGTPYRGGEREEKRPRTDFKRHDYSNEICDYVYPNGNMCKEKGHTGWFHNRFFPRKPVPPKKGEESNEGAAHVAQGSQEADCEDSEDDGDVDGHDESDKPAYCFAVGELEGKTSSDIVWGVDSCYTHHMTGERTVLSNMKETTPLTVTVANRGRLVATEVGEATLLVRNLNGELREIKLTAVYYVPGLAMNLISVGQLADKGAYFRTGKGDKAVCVDEKSRVVFECKRRNGLYEVVSEKERLALRNSGEAYYVEKAADTEDNWHARMGHLNYDAIRKMDREGLVKGLRITNKRTREDDNCEPCMVGKLKRGKVPKKSTRPEGERLRVASADIVGPINVLSRHKNKHIFFHNFLGYTETKFGDVRSLATTAVLNFLRALERREQKAATVGVLRTDGGSEYTAHRVVRYLEEHGIAQEITEPETPNQNGQAERKHQTVLDMARTMLLASAVPKSFWEEAVNYAVYVRNRVTSKSTPGGKTPFELMFGYKPDVSHLRVFGEKCHYTKTRRHGKTTDKGIPGFFMGMDEVRKGYLVWNNATRKLIHSHNVRFTSNVAERAVTMGEQRVEAVGQERRYKPRVVMRGVQQQGVDGRGSKTADRTEAQEDGGGSDAVEAEERDIEEENDADGENNNDSDEDDADGDGVTLALDDPDDNDSDEIRVHLNAAEVAAYNGGNELTDRRRSERRSARTVGEAHMVMMEEICEPMSYNEARASPQWDEWKAAMITEIRALQANGTWVWRERDPNRRPVKCKWVYKVKMNSENEIEKLRARLVACGYTQVRYVDYFETKAHVSKKSSLRFTVSLKEKYGLEDEVFDVPVAFVQAFLDVEIDMELPPGFHGEEHVITNLLEEAGLDPTKRWVIRLVKGLYGLKQSGRTWNEEINGKLKQLGLTPTMADRCLYYKVSEDKKRILLLLLYVDDILIVHNWHELRDEIVLALETAYNIKKLGRLRHFLGMNFKSTPGKGTLISQERYANELLRRFGVDADPGSSLPMVPKTQLVSGPSGVAVNSTRYKQIVGGLLYLSTCTRPDISFAVNRAAKYSESPTDEHWTALYKILSYVRQTPGYGLWMAANDEEIVLWTDADWANDTETRRSISGGLVTLWGAPIAWLSKQQTIVARSTTLAEIIAAATGILEADRVLSTIKEMGLKSVGQPVLLRMDNKPAINLVRDQNTSGNDKHVDVRYHTVRQEITNGTYDVMYAPSNEMLADILTKPLARPAFEYLRKRCGVRPGKID